MAAVTTSSMLARTSRRNVVTIPDFLAPCFACWQLGKATTPKSFSTSTKSSYPRDRNPNRGVSPIRRTGLRQPLSVSKYPLPKPDLDASKKTQVKVDEKHGLWQFFDDEKNPLRTPEEDMEHGRAWTAEELRKKSWEDLHRLWWVCVKERNRIETYTIERRKMNAGFGDKEASERDDEARKTQAAIKHVLTERWYAWEDARALAMEDPTVDLSGEGPALLREQEVVPAELESVAPSEPRAPSEGKV